MADKITIKCPAKINLFLHILGRRDDGYHDIYTLFYPVSLYDVLTIEKSSTTSLKCSNAYIPVDENNIIIKTHNILKSQYHLKDNYMIYLEKNIPFGAGLGGGSSDAAKYLLAVNKLSGLDLKYSDMKNIMEQVGSDTVFFLHNKPMIATGRGEVLEDAPELPPLYFIIINPEIFISTKDVYTSPFLKHSHMDITKNLKKVYTFEELKCIMANDMESAVFKLHSEVAELLEYLKSISNNAALMSGSGSTVFAVFDNEAERDTAYKKVKERYKSYFTIKASIFKEDA